MSEDVKYEGETTLQFTCGECGQALDTSQREDRYGDVTILVDPCRVCVQAAENKGYDEGTEAAS